MSLVRQLSAFVKSGLDILRIKRTRILLYKNKKLFLTHEINATNNTVRQVKFRMKAAIRVGIGKESSHSEFGYVPLLRTDIFRSVPSCVIVQIR